MARYLVTGGAGFIGSHLVGALVDRGDAVVVLDDFSTGHEKNLPARGDVEVLRGDVTDPTLLAQAVRGVAGVFHQAAMASVRRSIAEPVRCEAVNAEATVALLEACRVEGVRRFVVASSAAVYGEEKTLPKHEGLVPSPCSPYAASKLSAEHYARVYSHLHGMHTVALRYFNVYGPRQSPESEYSAVVPAFADALRRSEAPVVYGDGEQTRDFCAVADVVEANLRAMEAADACGRAINVASGTPVSVNTLFERIRTLLGPAAASIEPLRKPRLAGDVQHSSADVTLARELLGYRARVALDEGLRRTLAWFAETSSTD